MCIASACSGSGGSGGGSGGAPRVTANTPLDGATSTPTNASASATFSQTMDEATLNATTVTLTQEPGSVPVAGTVVYADSRVDFWPSAHLEDNTLYTATITTGANNSAGIALGANHVWTFTTGDHGGPGNPVSLGTASGFVILAKAGISTVPTSVITGNLGVSPAAATSITGFDLSMDASNVFSTSTQVTGRIFAADYSPPSPDNLTTAVHDMELAFTDAAGRAPDVTELGAGNIGGMNLVPGVYKWSTGLLIPTDVTLTGSATDVWIFQIAQDLTMSTSAMVTLAGGALPKNVFWQVTGLVDIGASAHCEGVLLTATAITLGNGVSVNGRLLAQTAVTIDGGTIVQPAP
jgi:hypothetical protein